MKRLLIVNADDLGLRPGVAAGIFKAHHDGLVTSTTALMNAPGVEEALRQAQAECPRLGLGVHLTVTSGRPLTAAPSLAGPGGEFHRPEELLGALPALDPAELYAEWRAQVERFIAVTGLAPDHLDAHHHIAYKAPVLLRPMLELARAYGCAVRLATGVDGQEASPAGPGRPLREWGAPLLVELTPRHPDRLETSFYGPTATLSHLLELLAHLPEGTTELMCHPSYTEPELLAVSSYNRQREQELGALIDPQAREAVREQGIVLVSFADLGPG
jgi:hypothetical protein